MARPKGTTVEEIMKELERRERHSPAQPTRINDPIALECELLGKILLMHEFFQPKYSEHPRQHKVNNRRRIILLGAAGAACSGRTVVADG
jgi:hypothetical protein